MREDEIDGVLQEQGEQALRTVDRHCKCDPPVTTLIVGNGVGQEAGRHRFGDGDPHMTPSESAQAVNLRLELSSSFRERRT